MPKRKTSGDQTKDRILDAALETVRIQGLVGTSARAIARTGDFNQALIFYHFGSVEELLYAAIVRAHDRRIERFGDELAEVSDLAGLAAVAAKMRTVDGSEADSAALAALVGAWPADSETGRKIVEVLAPWDEMIGQALRRSCAEMSWGSVLPYEELARLLSASFLGIEVFNRLDPDDDLTARVFDALQTVSAMASLVLKSEPN